MIRAIAKLFEPLLRLVLPGSGRHRDPVSFPMSFPVLAPSPPRVNPPTARRPRADVPMLRGEDTKLVRPYLIAHERWEEAQQRRALRLVGHGHYIDPSFTHGVEVRV